MTRCTWFGPAWLALLLLAPGFAAAQTEKPVDIAGQWEMTAETPVGNFTSTLKLERTGDQFTGVTVGQDGKEVRLNDLKLVGKTLTFTEDVSFNGEPYHLAYTGTIDGDRISGTFQSSGETMDWSARRKAPAAPAAPGVAGTWKVSVDSTNGPTEGTLVLKQDGDTLSGSATGPDGQSLAMQNVTLKGNELRFTLSMERNGETVPLTFMANVTGDTLTGTVSSGDQMRHLTGKRQGAPAAAVSLVGTWKLAVQAPDQTYHPTVTLSQQDGKWSGTLADEQGDKADLKDLTVNGSHLSFTADLDTNGMVIHLKFNGTLEGDRLSGTMEANDNSLPTTGARAPKA